MQKVIISMLLIVSMLTGCGKIKNFLHPEINENKIENNEAVAALKARLEALEAKDKVVENPKANEDVAALKARLKALEAKNKAGPKINADSATLANEDVAALKARLEALELKNNGWWNWQLGEEGWRSWISTKTIGITIGTMLVGSQILAHYWIHEDAKWIDTVSDRSLTMNTNFQNHELNTAIHNQPG